MRVGNQVHSPLQTLHQKLMQIWTADSRRKPEEAQPQKPTPQEKLNQEVKALMAKSSLHVSSARVDTWA